MSDIKIIPFEGWHLTIINVQEEQQYIYDFFQERGISPEIYGNVLLSNAVQEGEFPCAWSYYCDGEILGCGGIMQTSYPHIGEAWCIFGKDFKKCFKTAVKRIKQAVKDCPCERVQALTETDFPVAQRFLEFLGFQQEGIMRKQGLDKKDNIIYSIIKD